MNIFQSILLGIVQGLTEFIPVSSTAHLILVPWLFNWHIDANASFVFDVLLQWGTLVAVFAYFWRDLWQIAGAVPRDLLKRQPFASAEARLGWLIVVATVPAIGIALPFKDFFEGLHQQPLAVILILMGAAALLFGSEWLGKRNRPLTALTWRDALIIGCSQALALLPGVSRSAATICGGLACNLERPAAARFSFLMSIPALLGAGLIAILKLIELPNFTSYLPSLAFGFVAAAGVGYLSIHWLLGYLSKRSMQVFGWYRLAVGAVCLIIFFIR